ncbi:MCE family protein [Nocardioides sp. Kera G14]|uniref:MCE family protein n=1 Tax=Nocardioides sp. Kera G14 TaxID=2884264 RepID=UPI001D123190|nr:MCE family protein [Nocardioides sp. Kera G14]UDY22320.1 MCE family protein [Nocardioides sp. Kera G14]
MRPLLRSAVAAVTAALVLGSLSGCGTSVRDMPLPGSGVSGDTIKVVMDFDEALNLAVGAPVKVNGVDAGKVKEIEARDFKARTEVQVKTSAQLRRGATARLRYTTPLGEIFVDVTNPASGTLLRSGEELTTAETSTAPTVEDALSEASLLINGGGLAQLQTVTTELNKAIGGREDTVRDLLLQTSTFMQVANQTTKSIDAALTALDSTSQTLAARRETINKALTQIKPAADVLRKETPNFTALLTALQKFSATANSTVKATRTQLLGAITEIEPVLAELAANKGRWADSLDQLAALGKAIDDVVSNDYLDVNLQLAIDPATLLGGNGGSTGGTSTGGTSGGLGGLVGGLLGGGSTGSSGSGSGLLGLGIGGLLRPQAGK